jgi:hypothetical protein
MMNGLFVDPQIGEGRGNFGFPGCPGSGTMVRGIVHIDPVKDRPGGIRFGVLQQAAEFARFSEQRLIAMVAPVARVGLAERVLHFIGLSPGKRGSIDWRRVFLMFISILCLIFKGASNPEHVFPSR